METSNAFDMLILPLCQCLGGLLLGLMGIQAVQVATDRILKPVRRSKFEPIRRHRPIRAHAVHLFR